MKVNQLDDIKKSNILPRTFPPCNTYIVTKLHSQGLQPSAGSGPQSVQGHHLTGYYCGSGHRDHKPIMGWPPRTIHKTSVNKKNNPGISWTFKYLLIKTANTEAHSGFGTFTMLGLCRNISAGKSCIMTSHRSSHVVRIKLVLLLLSELF